MGVRRESVELSLQDIDFTTGMAKAAGQTALLNRELDALDGNSVRASRSTKTVGDSTERSGTQARRASSDLNQFTGRLGLLATAAATLGPALLPIGATAVPAVTALAGGLGAAAGAVGTAVLAFHGLGDGLKALNDYQLDPTEAHFEKLQQQMSKLSPAARALVQRLDELGPVVTRLQRTAQHGMFPGVNEGLTEILTLTPEVTRIVEQLSLTMGRLASDAGASLKNDADWQAFFHFLETDAGPTLDAFARATGNVVAGLGSMLVAFRPLSQDFTTGMLEMSQGFREWAAGLSESDGFQSFVEYIRTSGPQVAAFLGAIGDALVGLAQAAAPWGSLVLPILTDVLKVFSALASSPIGPALFTAAAGALAISRTAAGLSAVSTSLGTLGVNSQKAGKGLQSLGAKAGGILLLGQALGGLANSFNTGNAVNMGDLGRDIEKISGGGTTLSLKRLAESLEDVNERGAGTVNALFAIPSTLFSVKTSFEQGKDTIDAFDQQLAQMVESGNAKEAAVLFERIREAAAGHGGVSDEDVVKSFDSYRTALDNTKGTLRQTATATEHYALSQARAAERVKALEKAMQEQRKQARETAGQFTAFGDSLDDSEVSLAKWVNSMARQAKALRDFTANARTAARRGLREGLIAELEAAGPAGALRMKQLANASDSEIRRANRAWASGRQAIRDYVAMKVPPKTINVVVDPGAAARIQWVKDQIASIHDKTVRVTAYAHLVNLPGKLAGMQADRGYAAGGYTAGPTVTCIPANLTEGA